MWAWLSFVFCGICHGSDDPDVDLRARAGFSAHIWPAATLDRRIILYTHSYSTIQSDSLTNSIENIGFIHLPQQIILPIETGTKRRARKEGSITWQ